MNHTKILFAVIETARTGLPVDPDEALKLVASLIDQLDKTSERYQKDMADLVTIGACIWQMKPG